jgi:hypothetical protein
MRASNLCDRQTLGIISGARRALIGSLLTYRFIANTTCTVLCIAQTVMGVVIFSSAARRAQREVCCALATGRPI